MRWLQHRMVVIAEKDLEIRGPGEFWHTAGWYTEFKAADILRDESLLHAARREAEKQVETEE